MTNMPEAKLAREAELCYATVAMVTDYDCWHPDHDHVTVEMVLKVLFQNADKAKSLIKRPLPLAAQDHDCAPRLPPRARQRDHHAQKAIAIRWRMAKLDAIAARVLKKV